MLGSYPYIPAQLESICSDYYQSRAFAGCFNELTQYGSDSTYDSLALLGSDSHRSWSSIIGVELGREKGGV